MSRELRLLGATLEWPRTTAAAQRLRALSTGALDWDRVVTLVRRHRVAGLAHHALREADVTPAPEAAQRLRTLAGDAAAEELRMMIELARLTRELTGPGAQPVVLKGLASAMTGFGRIGLRQNRDIDLLVREDAVSDVVQRVQDDGYVQIEPEGRLSAQGWSDRIRSHKDAVFHHPGRGVVLEIHWRLFDNQRFADTVSFAEPATVALPLGGAVAALPETTAILYMGGHGAQHAWSRAKWLADFGACCTALGPTRLEELYDGVRGEGLGLALAQGLVLASWLWERPIPSAVLEDLKRSRRLRMIVRLGAEAIAGGGETPELEDRLFGPTLKTLSHYLLSGDTGYILKQLMIDAFEPPSAQASPLARRLGPLAKAPLWVLDRLQQQSRRVRAND